jgi:hypothetical protein
MNWTNNIFRFSCWLLTVSVTSIYCMFNSLFRTIPIPAPCQQSSCVAHLPQARQQPIPLATLADCLGAGSCWIHGEGSCKKTPSLNIVSGERGWLWLVTYIRPHHVCQRWRRETEGKAGPIKRARVAREHLLCHRMIIMIFYKNHRPASAAAGGWTTYAKL